MSCHIASYANRSYAALESELGAVAAITSSHRLPLSKLDIRSVREASQRLDKSGGRTFVGVPHNGREHTTIEFSSYLTGWDSMSGVPELDAACGWLTMTREVLVALASFMIFSSLCE